MSGASVQIPERTTVRQHRYKREVLYCDRSSLIFVNVNDVDAEAYSLCPLPRYDTMRIISVL